MLARIVLLFALQGVDSQLCKLSQAPSNTTQGIWPGTNVLLNCTVFNGSVDRFSWKKDGHLLNNTALIWPEAQDGSHLFTWEGLKLDNITNTDNGQYSCVVSKDGKIDEDLLTIHIFAKPKITSPQQLYIESKQGNSIVSICSADGWPKPTVFWRKKGRNNELTNVFGTSRGIVLYIQFVRNEDMGFYICYANNSVGTENRPLLVFVSIQAQPKDPVKVSATYHHVVAYVSQSVTLRCKGLNVFEKYTIAYWEHNGTLQHGRGLEGHRFITDHEVDCWYTINSVKVEDSGNYTCAVQTGRDKDEKVIQLDIMDNGPPIVFTQAPFVQTNLGRPATLSCTFRHVDSSKADLFWLKSKTKSKIQSSEHERIRTTTRNDGSVAYSLEISNVSRQHIGCYGCGVNTSYGWNSSEICLGLFDFSKGFQSTFQSNPPSSKPLSTVWYTAIPTLLMCVCIAGFIVGKLFKRKKARNSTFWVSGENSESYQYDVFITFSSKDFDWVKSELIPLLEKHHLDYCIHQRDFEPGKTIVDNMADSVYKSRHILAVLSKNYMSSTFCLGELDIALSRTTQMKDSSLIAIRIDEIDKKCLPKALRTQIFLDFNNGAKTEEALEAQLTKLELIEKNSG